MEIKLDQIKAFSVLSGASIVICLTAGIPYVIYLDYELFLKIDIFKLIFLSIAISGPTILINTLLCQISIVKTHNIPLNNHLGIKQSTIVAVISSIFPLYLPIGAGYYFKQTPNEIIKNYAIIETITLVLLTLMLFIATIENNIKRKKVIKSEKEEKRQE